jgi:hypothetical protein
LSSEITETLKKPMMSKILREAEGVMMDREGKTQRMRQTEGRGLPYPSLKAIPSTKKTLTKLM